MPRVQNRSPGPTGGLRLPRRPFKSWRWESDAALLSRAVRCLKEEWHLVRARWDEAEGPLPHVTLRYLNNDDEIERQAVLLQPSPAVANELIGWFLTPPNATHFQVHLGLAALGLRGVDAHPVGSRDPVCHPAANVPRWATYHRSHAPERILLPPALESLTNALRDCDARVAAPANSIAAFATAIRGSIAVLDPDWIARKQLTWNDLTRLANDAVIIVDLESAAKIAAAHAKTELRAANYRDKHYLFSAKNEYADTATRGFALQDIFPYSIIDENGAFQMRTIRYSREWKRFADEHAIATLVSCQTPWEGRVRDVLSASMPTARGELLITDIPWLAAGERGKLLAPRLIAHLLRMHAGCPLSEDGQYWNRWDETHIIIRDIADMTRRYAGLQPARFAPGGGAALLGITLKPNEARRHVIFETGRIDLRERHDGVAPEPMMIVMRVLERRLREGDAWALRNLAGCGVTWVFASASGHKYATMFPAGAAINAESTSFVQMRMSDADTAETMASVRRITLRDDVGLLGDGSIEFVGRLMERVKKEIERAAK
ncbi:MAG: hypothetical protein JNG88_15360 [Phycisphaerales bacterium]|nr:hypothetical protein [Phycisphaerales bacterium]